MAKIAISLPDAVFQAIERERSASGESRSQFLRRAVEGLLRRQRERQWDEQYVRGYQRYPERPTEIEGLQAASLPVLADLPWEDSD